MNIFFLYGSLFFLGAVWGSFFYALALRLSSENFTIAVLFNRSRCPFCSSPISALHLIPIFGYVLSRRRCANCGISISPAYPLMEILYGSLAVLIESRYGISLIAFNYFFVASISIAIAVVDAKTMKIPSILLWTLLFTSLPLVYHNFTTNSPINAIGGFLVLGIFFIVILLIFPGSFGGGDVRFAALLGLTAGLKSSIVLLEIALISGAVCGIFYGIISKKGIRIKIPFAPFLTFGFIITMLWGKEIVEIYYQFLYY
ncbi:MAG: prepilin peptidase [Spirochaetes bacterium]|nr:prepilin peptidase [Spirochaetota bacterium]